MIRALTFKQAGNYGAAEWNAMEEKEMPWKDSISLLKMMVQGIMTKTIDLCDKSPPGYVILRGERTRLLLIGKYRVADRKYSRDWHKR